MIEFFKKILLSFGINWSILYVSFSRIFQALGGLITIFLIATFMSKEDQGFYYTFASVLAIQVFFELGLGGIITQFVAHEMSQISIIDYKEIEGSPENISRLSSLMHFSLKWYSIFAGMLFICLIIVGFIFFSKFGSNYTTVKWEIPWILISFGTSLNLLISPWMAVLQGMNKVKEMARIALIQQLVVMVITWLSLIMGAKLYIAAINSMFGFIVLLFLYNRSPYPELLILIYKRKIKERISYKREIFPYQWKIALSWISGYMIFQLFNPVTFAFCGAVSAGQMGMTLTALNAIFALILSWTTTKIPLWSMFIANNDYLNLNNSLKKAISNSTIIGVICILLFIAFLILAGALKLSILNRFLPLWLCALLSVTILFNNIINSWATYLRCHKKEPFLIQAIIVGFLCAISIYISAKYFGVNAVVIGYTSIVVFVSMPISYYIFITKKKAYHG